MKNYKVEATMKFTDKEENTKRNVGDVFEVTEARYNFLKKNNAVKLIEVIEGKEELVATVQAIIEEIPNATGETEIALLNDERPKKKKTNKK